MYVLYDTPLSEIGYKGHESRRVLNSIGIHLTTHESRIKSIASESVQQNAASDPEIKSYCL